MNWLKKQFKTVFNETAMLFNTICVSAGKVGYQIEVNPDQLLKYVNASYADIIKEK